jgi:hypothetical protein
MTEEEKTYPELPEDGDPDAAGDEEVPEEDFATEADDTMDVEENDDPEQEGGE